MTVREPLHLSIRTSSAALSGANAGRLPRVERKERRTLHNAAFAAGQAAAAARPRLVPIDKQLRAIPLSEFLASRPVDDIVETRLLPVLTGLQRVKRSLDEILIAAAREAVQS